MKGVPPPHITQPREGYQYLDSRPCKGCRALIHWWETVLGKPSPHDADGVSHFATCPVATRFRKSQEEAS